MKHAMLSMVLTTFASTHGAAPGAGVASCKPREQRSINDAPSGVWREVIHMAPATIAGAALRAQTGRGAGWDRDSIIIAIQGWVATGAPLTNPSSMLFHALQPRHRGRHRAPARSPRWSGSAMPHQPCPMRCSERAMSIICLFVSFWESVLETQ